MRNLANRSIRSIGRTRGSVAAGVAFERARGRSAGRTSGS